MGQKSKLTDPLSDCRLELIAMRLNWKREFFFFIPKLEVLELLNVSIIGTAANYLGRARWPQRIGIL